MPDSQSAGNAGEERTDVACPGLRDIRRDGFVVADSSRDEKSTRPEQDVNKTQSLRLGHAPRMEVFTADSVGVILLTLEDDDVCATASYDEGEGGASESSTDNHKIALHPHSAIFRV